MQHVSSGGDERAIAAATQGLTPSWLHSREFNDSGSLQLELGLIVQNMQSQCFYTQILSSRSIGEHPNSHKHRLSGDFQR